MWTREPCQSMPLSPKGRDGHRPGSGGPRSPALRFFSGSRTTVPAGAGPDQATRGDAARRGAVPVPPRLGSVWIVRRLAPSGAGRSGERRSTRPAEGRALIVEKSRILLIDLTSLGMVTIVRRAIGGRRSWERGNAASGNAKRPGR